MRNYPLLLLVGLLALGTAAACDTDPGAPVEIEATGAVAGLAWLDRNGTGELDGTDAPVRDVTIHLTSRSGERPLFTATSIASGEFVFEDVPVGDYRARVDETTVGDTIRLLRVDSADVTVAAGETSIVLVGFSYPGVPIDSARQAEVDTRLMVEGLALNRWNVFGDATVHVRDTTGAIVAIQVPQSNVQAGDSLRILGTVRTQSGQPVLQDVTIFRLRTGTESPPAETVTAQLARLADDGRLDAALVRLDSAVIRDTTRNALGEVVFHVEDETGTARVLLDRDISFFLNFPTVVIGTILDVTGLLVPAAQAGEWVLKPRATDDIVIGPLAFPTLPIAEARHEPVDTRLIVKGRALNAWTTFGDATVHVRDSTGAIRAIQVPATNIQAGDSIQIIGTIATFTGQPVLRFVHTTILQTGTGSPDPDSVDTGTAASADAGRLDAGLVRIVDAVIQDTTRNADGELVLHASDGSGVVRVILDRDIPFNLQWPRENGQPVVIGTRIDATGVLVPRAQGLGEWTLKPRGTADIQLRPGDTGEG